MLSEFATFIKSNDVCYRCNYYYESCTSRVKGHNMRICGKVRNGS